ncbi:hypothetical protein [Streptomyces sp. NPDC057253]|uniref:hypothetical protein n=1 Tax=Streptomyces sp. NPDC057253 TaxID=3346069 RepID=UPI003632A6AD
MHDPTPTTTGSPGRTCVSTRIDELSSQPVPERTTSARDLAEEVLSAQAFMDSGHASGCGRGEASWVICTEHGCPGRRSKRKSLERVEEIANLGMGEVAVTAIPPCLRQWWLHVERAVENAQLPRTQAPGNWNSSLDV